MLILQLLEQDRNSAYISALTILNLCALQVRNTAAYPKTLSVLNASESKAFLFIPSSAYLLEFVCSQADTRWTSLLRKPSNADRVAFRAICTCRSKSPKDKKPPLLLGDFTNTTLLPPAPKQQ